MSQNVWFNRIVDIADGQFSWHSFWKIYLGWRNFMSRHFHTVVVQEEKPFEVTSFAPWSSLGITTTHVIEKNFVWNSIR